jgi:predicted enzyme related to lactoylglutathione lyase
MDVSANGDGINGGVGGGESHERRVLFYVEVPDLEETPGRAEALGGMRRMGPRASPGHSSPDSSPIPRGT